MKIILKYNSEERASQELAHFDEEWPRRKLAGDTITFSFSDARASGKVLDYAVYHMSYSGHPIVHCIVEP